MSVHLDTICERKYQHLIKCKASHSGIDPRGISLLGVWCKVQQKLYHEGNMKDQRLRRLKEAGFDLGKSAGEREASSRN